MQKVETSPTNTGTRKNLAFLKHKGEMCKLIRDYDWAKTSIGPIDSWPQSLRTAVNIILQSEVPMVMLWGTDGVMIYNDAYSVFAGGRHPKLLGSKVVEGWPEVADFNRHVLDTGLKGKTLSYDDQQLVLYRNNVPEDVWMNLNYSPVMNEDGDPAGVLAIVIETTERVQAEQRLSSTRTQLDSALAIGLTSTWSWDMKEDIIVGDSNFAKSFGITLEEAQKGLPLNIIMDAIHEDDRQRVSDAIAKSIAEKRIYEEEYRTINAKGETSWMIARGEILNDESETPRYFLGVLIDITDRRKAQKDLVETKQKFDALFDSTVVAIAMAKTGGTIVQGNKTFLELFGYKQKDMDKGITSAELTAPESYTTTKQIYDSVRKTGEAEPTEKIYVRKDGTQFPAIVGAARLPDSKDTFMAFILDISENQRLKDLNETKDEFIALASHQLRTPASSVKQYLGVLAEEFAGPLTDEQMKYLNVALRANDRQLAIINDLLKTAQIDTKGYDLTLKPKNMVSIIQEVVNQYQPALESKGQKITFTSTDEKIIVRLDETEISICLSNIIENASKYSPDNTNVGINLSVDDGYAKIVVKDHGVGIEKKDQEKIFDKFTRINNDLSNTVNGSGLGLYWVRKSLRSIKEPFKSNQGLAKEPALLYDYPMSKVLVVEDEKDLRDIYEIILTRAGYEVGTSANGREALEMVKTYKPEIILLDIFMPILDGKGFLKAVDLGEHPGMKVIVCSNTSDNKLMQEMMKLGADKVVTKADLGPMELTKLVKSYA